MMAPRYSGILKQLGNSVARLVPRQHLGQTVYWGSPTDKAQNGNQNLESC